jgi:predicted N-acetyltransferase YhbS
VFRAGATFPHDPAISEAEAQVTWVEQSQAVMVAVDPTGALMANVGNVVADYCRRQGIGSRLCQHSLQAARRLGFRAVSSTWW